MSLENMINTQLVERGIQDNRVLDSFRKVDRKLFVPADRQNQTYADTPLPIGYQQTISQPYIVAYMLEKLKPTPKDKILEVGTGSGYQTALLANLCRDVYTVEIIRPLLTSAQERLKKYSNIHFKLASKELG